MHSPAPSRLSTLPHTTLFRSIGGELAGLEDHFEVDIPAGLLDPSDLVEDLEVLPRQECAPVDDHVDLVRPVGDDHPGLLDLQLRSEEHTSELQSRENLVCRLL